MTDHPNHETNALDRRVHEALAAEYAREQKRPGIRRRIYSGAIAVGVVTIAGVLGFLAITGDDPTPLAAVHDSATLQAALADRGLDITPHATGGDESMSPLGGDETSFCATNSLVLVYHYPTIEDRTKASSTIKPDGTLASPSPFPWPDPPIFFAHDRLIVAVLGTDATLIEALTDILGPTISPESTGDAPTLPTPCST